jgi:hypothetical protein
MQDQKGQNQNHPENGSSTPTPQTSLFDSSLSDAKRTSQTPQEDVSLTNAKHASHFDLPQSNP